MQTEPKTIGERLFAAANRRQSFLRQRLRGVAPEAMRVIKLDQPRESGRPSDIRMARHEIKLLPYSNFQASAQVFDSQLPLADLEAREVFANAAPPANTLERKEEAAQCMDIKLSPKLLDRFSQLLRFRLPRVFLHHHTNAEEILKRRNADAMTLGNHIYFRKDTMNLESPRGMALLGHELTHVAQQSAEPGNPRVGNSEGRERAALANERLVLHHAPVLRSEAAPIGTTGSLNSISPQTGLKPMFAEASRSISPMPEPAISPTINGSLSGQDLARLKEDIYRDLRMRFKTELERGG